MLGRTDQSHMEQPATKTTSVNLFDELDELQRIVNRLESIQSGSPAAVLENLAEWLNFDAPKMGPLLDDLRNELMKHAGTLG